VATVYNNIDKVAGDPQSSATVKIELLFDKDEASVAKHVSSEVMIQGYFSTSVNTAGEWSTSLVPNSEITPSDNVYFVTETITEAGSSKQSVTSYYVTVPVSATPVFWVGGLIVPKPGWVQ